jgi:hypothetical protein
MRSARTLSDRVRASRLPYARAIYYPDDGHLIFFSRIEEILTALVACRYRPWP